MKKELCRQVSQMQISIDEMYDKWQRAVQCTNQICKKFREYLQSIQSNQLDFDKVRALNKTHLLHQMQ